MNRSLKISMGVTSLVLILAAVIAWQDHRRLVSARERNADAVSGAAALGISVGSGGTNGPVLVTKRDRQAGDARREVDEVMAMLHAAAVGEKEGKGHGAGV
ncbi:MAG: hypothetical protein EOP85_11960 [Verrucomicrobiaceae bacterium]|nr:MAG: hypothetical protein EOP85_11960 [Verrucomicrobiaceae bacterium]